MREKNINTKRYWETRFSSGDWEARQGRLQTRAFAESNVRHMAIPADFTGTIVDFGCGLGDAMPVYRAAYPRARLIGMDVSQAAVEKCREVYGDIASFQQGDHTSVPEADVIIASNVLEHLDAHIEVARALLSRCRDLYIVVPFREPLVEGGEHVNRYDENTFNALGPCRSVVFRSRGWTGYGMRPTLPQRLKMLLRPILRRRTWLRWRQIMFHLSRTP